MVEKLTKFEFTLEEVQNMEFAFLRLIDQYKGDYRFNSSYYEGLNEVAIDRLLLHGQINMEFLINGISGVKDVIRLKRTGKVSNGLLTWLRND